MENYTPLLLFILGMLGVILHNLIQLDKINRDNNGNINWIKYVKMERFSILISVIVVTLAVICSQEIRRLAIGGNWLGLGFICLGYMAQSILVFFMKKAKEKIGNKDEK